MATYIGTGLDTSNVMLGVEFIASALAINSGAILTSGSKLAGAIENKGTFKKTDQMPTNNITGNGGSTDLSSTTVAAKTDLPIAGALNLNGKTLLMQNG